VTDGSESGIADSYEHSVIFYDTTARVPRFRDLGRNAKYRMACLIDQEKKNAGALKPNGSVNN
jgi:hypothetical protein